MTVLSPSKAALIVLMLLQFTLHLPKVSAEIDSVTNTTESLFNKTQNIDSATNSVESLFGKAQGIHLGGTVLAAVVIVVGAVVLTFGFCLIRVTLFIIGFVAGGIAIAMITEHLFRDEPWVILASWVAFGVGGILCGAVITWLYPLSTFVAGAATGIVTAMIVINTVGYKIYPGHTKDLLMLMCAVLGILFGVLALLVGKPLLIISTSLLGSCMVVWGVGYFAGDIPNVTDLEQYAEDINGETVYSIPMAWWGYLAGIVVLFVLGMYIQFKKTARNVEDNRPKGFGRRRDVAEYVEKKTARNRNHDSVGMEAPPPRRQPQVRRQREAREQRQPRPVREVREVRQQQAPSKKRTIKQQQQAPPSPQYSSAPRRQQAPPPPQYSSAPRRQYADLDATDEIVEYEERMPQQKRIYYSERESSLYDFEANREPCRICGDYVHRDSSCCSEKVARIERH